MNEHSFRLHFEYPIWMLLKMFDDYKLHLYAWNNPPGKDPMITVFGAPENIERLKKDLKEFKELSEKVMKEHAKV